MPTLFKNKYRIKSTRLKGWDYSYNGVYFVTICTRNRQCNFGHIEKTRVKLSKIGRIAQQYWLEIPRHYPFITLDEYIIMPNHIHGIIIINNDNTNVLHVSRRDEAMPRLYIGDYPQMSAISPKPNSLSSIIGSFKSICTKQIRKLYNPYFHWQSRFYDHIIRNNESLDEIRQYIIDNPLKWEFDKNNPKRKETVETQNFASLH